MQDLCRIKWEPDPHVLPENWFRGHIPDMIKCKMFELWQEDPKKNSAMVREHQIYIYIYICITKSLIVFGRLVPLWKHACWGETIFLLLVVVIAVVF